MLDDIFSSAEANRVCEHSRLECLRNEMKRKKNVLGAFQIVAIIVWSYSDGF